MWLKRIDLFNVNPFFLHAIIKSWTKQLKIKLENVSFKHLEKKKAVSASVTLSFALTLTWDDRYSFQGSKNSERSQRRHTTQIHKLCYISETWRVGNQTLPDIQHTGRSRHRVAVGFKGHTDIADAPKRVLCLPGITEIVFKALSTLNVRRADTLPMCINSVTNLWDQMHRYK